MLLEPIKTDRLLIREFLETDLASIHVYASKEEVTRYVPFSPNSETDTKEFLTRAMAFQAQDPRNHYELAVILQENGTLIGGCGIHISNPLQREGFIGHCYDTTYWNKGYATEAGNALLQFGFGQLKLHRIYATCFPENFGSAKVLEKLGIQKEGRLREHMLQRGQWRDSLQYSILDYEYTPATSPVSNY